MRRVMRVRRVRRVRLHHELWPGDDERKNSVYLHSLLTGAWEEEARGERGNGGGGFTCSVCETAHTHILVFCVFATPHM